MTAPPTLRVLSVDVGVRHLSFAVLRVAAAAAEASGATTKGKAPEGALERAVELLRGGEVEEWRVQELERGDPASFSALLEAATRFVADRGDALARCDVLVLEQQMAPQMRCVASAIYAAARTRAPELRVVMQPGSAKLAWDAAGLEAFAPGARTDSYHGRKKAAVQLCGALLTSAGRVASLEAFRSHRKRDDLADALLHGLRFAVACVAGAAAPAAKKRRTR